MTTEPNEPNFSKSRETPVFRTAPKEIDETPVFRTEKETELPKAPRVLTEVVLSIEKFKFYYGQTLALREITMNVMRGEVVALIGPSGCGKSTLLKAINRIHEVSYPVRIEGRILLDGKDIYAPEVDVTALRRRVGMVFQKPNPFPKSVYENVAFGLKILGGYTKSDIDGIVEQSLKQAALWDEVKDRLHTNALGLSGGQQQRLCIARALATQPEILLMDEPCSALDPISTQKIEDLIDELKSQYTFIIVTHNMQQAARVSDRTAFMMQGSLIEYDSTEKIFTKPAQKLTEDYILGRFG
ncbi:MAG: phosphate ABC transporter ATP-binding protein PstB [Chloroherpetonaceae bacterium]|nr:phosphate ABC transporter ATP-binding protein PstB [Chloroherpetonaceae bacterium]MDW8020187.1 phosphate ABC transporter ATP-binding protein PstB [Chloroherpetonaceae bacterium]